MKSKGKWDSESEGEDDKSKGSSVATKRKKADKAPPPALAPAPAPAPAPRGYDPLMDGCRSVEEYEHVSFIDQGTYGMVFKARCKESGELCALKQVKLLGSECGKVGFPITALREINILLALRHPSIVRVKEMVIGATADKVFMVMEYCDRDLKTCMRSAKQPFSAAEVKQLTQQLLSAVAYMHSKWYLHRDLKTSNLLYSKTGRLSVCDFGLARAYSSPIAPFTAEVCTLWYRCPELLLGARVYSTALDVWSVGCILGELLTGQPLLPGEGELDQVTRIFRLVGAPSEDRWPGVTSLPNFPALSDRLLRAPTRGKLRELLPMTSFSGGPYLSPEGLGLLSSLLEMDPRRRISAEEALQHAWLESEPPLPAPMGCMPRFDSSDV